MLNNVPFLEKLYCGNTEILARNRVFPGRLAHLSFYYDKWIANGTSHSAYSHRPIAAAAGKPVECLNFFTTTNVIQSPQPCWRNEMPHPSFYEVNIL